MRSFPFLFTALVACGPPTPSAPKAGPLRAGVATVVVDVPVGAPTGGYSRTASARDPGSPWAQNFPATTGVHTDMTARALALTNGLTRSALVRLDVCLITPSLRARIRQKLDAAQEPARFVVQATHTHGGVARYFEPTHIGTATGPDFVAFGMDVYDPELDDRLATAAAKSIIDAFATLERVSVGAAVADGAAFNTDRRCENDPVYGPDFRDRSISVVRFDVVDEAGVPVRPLTALVNFAVHGTVMSGNNTLLTSDAPGAIELAASDRLGVPVVFLQGSAGDVSPRGSALGFEGTQRLEWAGQAAAKIIEAAFTRAQPAVAPGAGRLTHVDRGVLLTREALGYEKGTFPEHGGIGCMLGGPSCTDVRLTPVDMGALLCAPVEPRPRLRTPMALLQIEDVALITLPGEPTTAVGQKVAATLAPLGASMNLVLGYAQDHYGYLLEQDDFLRGGYEPTVSPWGWRMGQHLVDEASTLVATRAQAQEAPTSPTPVAVTPRSATDSSSAAGIVTDLIDVERLATVRLVFTGGDPTLGTPTVSVEREVDGRFVPAQASATRAIVNGPEVIRRYVATPTFRSAPMASSRRHEWTALWETLTDTPLGRYRLVATGRAQVAGVISPYRLESAPFQLRPARSIGSVSTEAVSGALFLVRANFPPNPMQFADGDPVGAFRLRDATTRPDVGARARGGEMTVILRSGGVSPTVLTATWDAARDAHVVSIPSGSWELTVEAGAFTDGAGNTNSSALRAQVSRP